VKAWPVVALQQIHEGAQLQAGDVGPAAAALHVSEQGEQLLTVRRQAAAEGAVLNRAMQGFQIPQQGQQLLGLAFEPVGEPLEILHQPPRGQLGILSLGRLVETFGHDCRVASRPTGC